MPFRSAVSVWVLAMFKRINNYMRNEKYFLVAKQIVSLNKHDQQNQTWEKKKNIKNNQKNETSFILKHIIFKLCHVSHPWPVPSTQRKKNEKQKKI